MPLRLAACSGQAARYAPGGAICAAGACALLLAIPTIAARADAAAMLAPSAGTFRLVHAPAVYTSANLETHLDGEAEAISRYDFRQDAYGEYAPGGHGSQLVTADVFQMAAPQDAYGLYSSQRNPHAAFQHIGAEGYEEPTALNFWKGPYYVRVAILAANPTAVYRTGMRAIAHAIAAKLPGPTNPPALLNILPPGMAPHSEEYLKANIAAQDYLRNGVTARYPAAGPQAELFVAVFPTAAAARQAYNQFAAYLQRPIDVAPGAKPQRLKGVGEAGIAVRTKFHGQVVAAVRGRSVAGVTRARDAAAAERLVREAVGRAPV